MFAGEGFSGVPRSPQRRSALPLVDDIEAHRRRIHRSLDARQEDDVSVFPGAADQERHVEVYIFNVGANVNVPLVDTTEPCSTRCGRSRAFAGFLAGRAAARLMLPHRRGAIFFTGAAASLRGGSAMRRFAAAKAGLRAWLISTARDCGREHPCSRSRDRCRVDTMVARTDQGARGRRGLRDLDPHRLMQPVRSLMRTGGFPAAARFMDVRDRYPSVRRSGDRDERSGIPFRLRQSEFIPGPPRNPSHRTDRARFLYVPVLLGGVFKPTDNRSPAEASPGSGTSRSTNNWRPREFVRRHGIEGSCGTRSFRSTRAADAWGDAAAGSAGSSGT